MGLIPVSTTSCGTSPTPPNSIAPKTHDWLVWFHVLFETIVYGTPLFVGRSQDLSAAVARMKLGQTRNLNLMVMHPRAPKIRHLNASHSLLIELEENVKKVQVC